MNRKQYFAVSWFFFVLMFFLMWFQLNYLQPSIFLFDDVLSSGAYYQLTKSAIVSAMIIITLPLFALFQILAWLEPKKMEDDAPKEHREVIKLARLEHEVKELKNKLKSKGKIRN